MIVGKVYTHYRTRKNRIPDRAIQYGTGRFNGVTGTMVQ